MRKQARRDYQDFLLCVRVLNRIAQAAQILKHDRRASRVLNRGKHVAFGFGADSFKRGNAVCQVVNVVANKDSHYDSVNYHTVKLLVNKAEEIRKLACFLDFVQIFLRELLALVDIAGGDSFTRCSELLDYFLTLSRLIPLLCEQSGGFQLLGVVEKFGVHRFVELCKDRVKVAPVLYDCVVYYVLKGQPGYVVLNEHLVYLVTYLLLTACA